MKLQPILILLLIISNIALGQSFQQAVDKLQFNADALEAIVNGPPNGAASEVALPNGGSQVTIARTLATIEAARDVSIDSIHTQFSNVLASEVSSTLENLATDLYVDGSVVILADGTRYQYFPTATEGDVPAQGGGFWRVLNNEFTPHPDGYFYIAVFGQSNGVGLGRGESFLDFTSTPTGEVWNHNTKQWEVYDISRKSEQYPPSFGGAPGVDGEYDFWVSLAYHFHLNYRTNVRYIFEVEGGQPAQRFSEDDGLSYLRMQEQLQEAGITRLDGFALVQGEANGGESAGQYQATLDNIIDHATSLQGWHAGSRFIAYETPEEYNGRTRATNIVNIILRRLNSDSNPLTTSIPIGQLSTLTDEIHYDSNALNEGGRLFAAAFSGELNPHILAAQKQGLFQDDFTIVDSTGVARSIKDSITPLTVPRPLATWDAKYNVDSDGVGSEVDRLTAKSLILGDIRADISGDLIDNGDSVRISEGGNGNGRFGFDIPLSRIGGASFTLYVEFTGIDPDNTFNSSILNLEAINGGDETAFCRLRHFGQTESFRYDWLDPSIGSELGIFNRTASAGRTTPEAQIRVLIIYNDKDKSIEMLIINDETGSRESNFFTYTSNDIETLRIETGFQRIVDFQRMEIYPCAFGTKMRENFLDSLYQVSK